MRQLRFAVGVALLMAVVTVLISGLIVRTRSDFQLILLGFVLGLFTVYAIERLKQADHERRTHPDGASALGNAPSMRS
ncbi:MAG: hypothetical protein ACP5G7_10965 [Anaerolineae bacterium]